MSKNQKIWLTIFLAMFLVPEVLWSLSGNFLYNNVRFLMNLDEAKINYGLFKFPDSSHETIFLRIVLIIQIIGLMGIFFEVAMKMKIKMAFKYLILAFVSLLLLSTILFLFFVFNFNPQIG